jgi:hypothetical protein
VEREKDNADTLRALRFAEKKLRVKTNTELAENSRRSGDDCASP